MEPDSPAFRRSCMRSHGGEGIPQDRFVARAVDTIRRGLVSLGCVALLAAAPTLPAQCEPFWLPGLGFPGVAGEAVASVAWDPDGSGPAPVELVVGGDFGVAGSARCRGLARCDLNTGAWSAFAAEAFARVTALAVLPNGDLVAAGVPTNGAGDVQRVARWNGAWSWLGGDFVGSVHTLHVTPAGQLHVGGPFVSIGGQPFGGVARWNGAAWLPLGSGFAIGGGIGWAMTMQSLPNGDLLVAGLFDHAGGVAAANVARWNGNAWFAVGSGLPGFVSALARTANGVLLAGGEFSVSGAGASASGLAVWNGSTFAPVFGLAGPYPFVPAASVRALLPLPGNRVVVAGFLQVAAPAIPFVAMLDTTTFAWSPVGAGAAAATDGIGYVNTMTRLPLGRFAVGGSFGRAGLSDVGNVALWNGAGWQALGTGLANGVVCSATLDDGTFVIGGGFAQIDGQSCSAIARRTGAGFVPLGGGLTQPSGHAGVAGTILPEPGGGLLVAGNFRFADGVAVGGLARWQGGTWSAFAAGGVDGGVHRMLRTSNGEIVVAGLFDTAGGVAAHHVARWNGTTWSGLGGGLDGTITALLELPNGDLLAAGTGLSPSGDVVMRWSGSAWTPLPPPSPAAFLVSSMLLLPGGDVVVGGFDLALPYALLSRWDGTTWQPLPAAFAGEIQALHVRPDGELVIGGSFRSVGGQPMPGLARWRGGVPLPIDGGVDGMVAMIDTLPNGNLVVGGYFATAGGRASSMVAELQLPCGPRVVREGQGCFGSVGLVELTANSQPWLGTTFTATATAIPPSSLAVVVFGLQPLTTPLFQLVPQGGTNCFLFVDPLQLLPKAPAGSALSVALALPAVPALAGLVLREQVVVLELGAGGSVQVVTGSNALAATLGTW